MSKKIHNHDNPADKIRPTVFSDGSTFDYANGYQSNGATASRDKTPAKIVQTGAVMSSNSLSALIIALLLAALLAIVTLVGFKAYHEQANERAIVNTINSSGAAEVVGGKVHNEGGASTVVVRDLKDKGIYKCDVSIVRDPTAKAFVFCSKPDPANFSIPVPYDPANVFYTTPKQDS